MTSKTILFVGMPVSVHVARWIEMTSHRGWSLHFFPVFPGPINENFEAVTIHWPCAPGDAPQMGQLSTARGAPFVRGASPPRLAARRGRRKQNRQAEAQEPLSVLVPALDLPRTRRSPQDVRVQSIHPSFEELGGEEALEAGAYRLGESTNSAPLLNGPGVLASVIRRVRPDLIHSMEFQHAGYLVLKAKELFGSGFPPWLATNFGSDIYYFQRFLDHKTQIERLLGNIDLYSCECVRDIGLARDLGYPGPALPVLPNSGGFDIDHLTALQSGLPPSRRRLLMIKGYQHFAGRALTALAVLTRFADRLRDYEIVLYSVGEEPYQLAKELVAECILNIRIVGYATHDEMLALFGQARIYMGISISDAISTSVLEAMAMGAFPIQTNTSCCDEWFTDGESGFIVPPDDIEFICERFARALDDDVLVDEAADINWKTVKARLDHDVLTRRIEDFYDKAFDHVRDQAGKPSESRTAEAELTRA